MARSANPDTVRVNTAGILVLIVIGEVAIALDWNLVSVALPSIGQALQVGPTTLQWVFSAYSLAFGGLLIVGGRLSDLFGEKNCFIAGCALYSLGAAASVLSDSIEPLIASRVLEGIGGAVLLPATLSLIASTFAKGQERLRALTIVTLGQSLATPLGTIVAGWLIGEVGWRGAFCLNLPLCLGALIAAPFVLPARAAGDEGHPPIDILGVVLVTAGSALVVGSLSTLVARGLEAPPMAFEAFAASLLILALFVVLQRKSPAPLVPMAVLGSRNLIPALFIQAFLVTDLAGQLTMVSMSLQKGMGFTPLQTGYALVPFGLMAIVMGVVVPRLGKFLLPNPRAALVVAFCLAGTGALILSCAPSSPDAYLFYFLPGLLIAAVGSMTGMTVSLGEVYGSVPAGHHGIASALIYMTRMLSMAVGVSMMVSSARIGAHDVAGAVPLGAFSTGYRIGALFCALGIAVTLLALRGRPPAPNSAVHAT